MKGRGNRKSICCGSIQFEGYVESNNCMVAEASF